MSKMWKYIKANLERNVCSTIKEYNSPKSYTYGELIFEIDRMGKDVDISGLEGAKCAILCRQSIEAVRALFLCWRIGMIAIPLSLNYGREHCKNIIEVTKPQVIISDDLGLCDGFDTVISIVEKQIFLSGNMHIVREEVLQNVELMMCTSGTTGEPKAIIFSAEAIQKNVALISGYFTVDNADTMLICRPIYHCAVLVGELLLSFLVGANIVLYSGGYQPFVIANILKNDEITVMCGTPTIFKGLSDCLKHRNVKGTLRTIALSGEYLLLKYAYAIRESFPTAKIFNVYGLTEAGPRVSYLPYEMFDDTPQSVGQPLSGVEIKIVYMNMDNKDNRHLGEIWIKTPTMMLGYYKENGVSKASLQEGWFNTGDIGTLDEHKNLYILGRNDDMLIKAGMNIYPQEVEKRLLKVTAIKEALVYGKIINGVEQIVADIVLEEEHKMELAYDIMQKVSFILPEYMMPSSITIVEDLPRNASGKVIRPSYKVRNLNDKV